MTYKTKILLNICGGILLTLLVAVFVFNPLQANVKALNGDLAKQASELDKIKKQIIEFQSAQSDLAKATFKDDIYDTVVIREDLSLVINDLEAAAERAGIEESIKIQEQAAAESPGRRAVVTGGVGSKVFDGLSLSDEVVYSMAVEGGFSSMVNFLRYLENLPHFTELSKITLSSLPEAGLNGQSRSSGNLTGSLDGVFLVKRPKP
jgi:hypothetical protein